MRFGFAASGACSIVAPRMLVAVSSRLSLVICAAVCITAAAAPGSPLLPDLRIESRTPQVTTVNGKKLLRFTTWSSNLGVGPIELRGGAVQGQFQEVDQRIYDSDGVGFTDRRAGTFIYHPTHGHIHFEEFADYYLKEVNAGDTPGSTVAASEKISFCLLDTQKAVPAHPGTVWSARYVQCSDFQGLSVGWVDVYDLTLPGQNIDLTGISSGTYWLELMVDRPNRLLESDESNNTSRVKVTVATGFSPEIALLGNGQRILNNDSTPALLDDTEFGFVDVPSGSVTRTFTIQNFGNGTLSLPGAPKVQISGSSDFAVSAQPLSPVAPGSGTTTFQITFDPSALGSRTATVVILNNDSDEASYQFAIIGNADADNDGLPDAWEAANNVTSPAADDDGDGVSNYNEFIAGTLPRDAASRFQIRAVQCDSAHCEVSFDSSAGRAYRLEYRDTLPDGWSIGASVVGHGATMMIPNTLGTPGVQRFYQLRTGFDLGATPDQIRSRRAARDALQ